MTVTYGDVSYTRLLFKWHGSVWKAIWPAYIIFIICYYILNIAYRFMLSGDVRLGFERAVVTFGKYQSVIPVQFLLGFYVSAVVARWWEQLNWVAWPDKFLLSISANLQDLDDESLHIRRTFTRYCNLLNTLVWKEISMKVKKRFPTDRHVVKAGLMTEAEYELYQNTTGEYGRWFVPVSWMVNLLGKCRREDRFSDFTHQKLVDELYAFRLGSAMLTIYDWVNMPLAYTQVVTIATYGYFAFCLVSRQALRYDSTISTNTYLDTYFPFFTTLEFIFYIGWLKVGEQLRCPFGEDDEDFDMNFVLDRNMHVGNMLVDELHKQRPPVVPDRYLGSARPHLPHTKASIRVADKIPDWRLAKYSIAPADAELLEEFIKAVGQRAAEPQPLTRAKSEENIPLKPANTP